MSCLYARRNNLGGASQINSPFGGETRFNSTSATPAFFNAVQGFLAPSASATMSSFAIPVSAAAYRGHIQRPLRNSNGIGGDADRQCS